METPGPHGRLVVIGASSGGIEALGIVLGGLAPDFPAPIVVAQHLDPRRSSRLGDILSSRTKLEVRSVEDRMPLTPGVVHLVPADRDVTVEGQTVSVDATGRRRPKPSIDGLLSTAAEHFGEDLIAVILTGEGMDGSEGAGLVQAAGGTVLVQDPRTARHPSMPLSLRPDSIDIAARLEDLPRILTDLVSAVGTAPVSDDDHELERFLRRLRTQTGIDFSAYKRPTIARRLHRRMVAVGARTLAEYMTRANRDPDEFQRLAGTFLIKVTEFFRDRDLFDHLRQRIVPEIIEASEQRERTIRIWSAGCATGEEAYSLAILFAEVLGDDLGQYNIRIFATDIDNDAVAFARRGVYGPSAVSGLPPEMVSRHFTPKDDRYEVKGRIRALTVFGQHDLAQRAPFPRIDMAVVRNVLIYFTPELQSRALQLFAFALREGGYLVLGKAESVTRHGHHFVLDESRLRVYRRVGGRVLIPGSRGRWPSSADSPTRSNPVAPTMLRPFGGQDGSDRRSSPLGRAETILANLPVGLVIVDRQYDILSINPSARRSLGIHGAAVGEDFVHTASRLPSNTLRESIDQAFSGVDASFVHEEAEPGVDARRTMLLTFHSHRSGGRPASEDMAVILIQDRSELAESERARLDTIARLEAELDGARQRAAALARESEELLAANQELTLANAEIRSSNEDLLVGNEEFQAASEEVETLNEELQATNEELETLNEELQATIEELNTTNDDLVARSTDLERMAAEVGAGDPGHAP